MNTLSVNVNREGFEYDIHSLVKAFYPECNVKVQTGEMTDSSDEGLPDIFISFEDDLVFLTLNYPGQNISNKISTKGLDRAFTKNALKKLIYTTLSEFTGTALPWGTLTGIRPTKIAMTLLMDDTPEEDIEDYMKTVYLLSDEKLSLAMDIAKREKGLLEKTAFGGGYSLYIGIPFCPTTCLYCSFTSFSISAFKDTVDSYLESLFRELEFAAGLNKDKVLDTVYIGGGTPTTLDPQQLERLLSKVEECFDLSHLKEWTVEAGRPDSITAEKLEVLKKHGVTRISINPQTMNQETLDFIGRRHTVEQTVEAFNLARSLGFDNINMDIILGLPGEDEEMVAYTIDEIKKLGPDSLTVHSLAIKRASKLSEWIEKNGISALVNTDKTMEIASDGAYSMGMKPYYLYRQKNMSGNFENVGYSLPGKEGLYNILIMEEVQTIVACGAGTVTKRVFPDDRIERCDDVKDVKLYISNIEEMIERKRKLFSV